MMTAPHPTKLGRTLLLITIISALLLGSLWVISPFLMAGIWAIMIAVATWPLLLAIEYRVGHRRWLAVCIMILGLLVALLLPLMLAISTLIKNSDQIIALADSLKSLAVPEPPGWLAHLPWIGDKFGQLWAQAASQGMQGLAAKAAPYAGNLTRWFAVRMGGIGMMLLQIVLSIGIAAILYLQGDAASAMLHRFARKLGGHKGSEMVTLATGAIRGVALGVCVTALIQAILGGIGLAITGIPFATILTALLFMLCIAQIGVMPILVPAVIWLYATGETGWGTFLLIWTTIVVNLDTFLRPWLIRRGADLPLLLIFAGVIGGLITMGLVGIFVGPMLLAVSYTLLNSWLYSDPSDEFDHPAEAANHTEAPPPAPPLEPDSPA